MVPTVPGLVSEMVVPWKSAGVSLPERARATRSSNAATYSWKGQRAGVLDVGHHQAARAVLAGDVHGDAEVHLRAHDAVRLAVALGVGVVERGQFAESLHHGPADDVRVGDLALAGDGAVLIDDAAVLVHHLDGDGALRSGQRNGDAGRHVLGNAAGGAAQGLKLLAGAGLDRRRARPAPGRKPRGRAPLAPWPLPVSNRCFQLSSTVERSRRYC